MPFRLKNVEATYQRLINKIFKEHIDWNAEVYVDDDIIIKSKSFEEHVEDLKEIFAVLDKYQLKLNKKRWGNLSKVDKQNLQRTYRLECRSICG